MKRKAFISILILTCFLFTGCWDINYYEEIGFLLTVAAEYHDDNLQCTYILPAVDAQYKGREESEILKINNAQSIRDARQKTRLSSQKITEAGKIQQVLLSKDLAEKGIGNFIQVFERDISNSTQPYLIIVDGSPRELLIALHDMPSKPRISFYINQLIKDNVVDSNMPETRLYRFGINKYAEYIDCIAPIIKSSENGILAEGSALFSGEKMTGTIDPKDTLVLLGMMNKFKKGEYMLPTLPGEPDLPQPNHGVAIKIRKCKSKIHTTIKDNIPVVEITLKMQCVLDEKSLNEPMTMELQKRLEAHISSEIKNDCMHVLDYTKEVNSDPLGIGNLFRAKYNDHFKKNPWSCKKVKYTVNVDANLRNTGLFN